MRGRLALATLASLLALAACGGSEGGLRVEDAWVRQPVGERPAAAYMTIVNDGAQADALLGAATEVAESAELHETVMEGTVMKMRPVSRLEIPAGERVALEPGGLHIMLKGITQELKPGDTITLTLRFQRAGQITVQAEVRELTSR
jgi:hypothetical protein